ncbi:hypothetical protein EI94DRAFT_1009310 [Lactarius quietus]|nr:hypothetical protein EI94DRAFT_1009310 [Lactarius quietus]
MICVAECDLSLPDSLLTLPTSSTRVADQSSAHFSHHNSDLSNQTTLHDKCSNKRSSFLGTLRSPLCHTLDTITPEGDTSRAHVPKITNDGFSAVVKSQAGHLWDHTSKCQCMTRHNQAATTTTDPKGKAKEENPAVSIAELVCPTMASPFLSNTSQPSSVPFSGTAPEDDDLFFPHLTRSVCCPQPRPTSSSNNRHPT